jgi:hypothetical protein
MMVSCDLHTWHILSEKVRSSLHRTEKYASIPVLLFRTNCTHVCSSLALRRKTVLPAFILEKVRAKLAKQWLPVNGKWLMEPPKGGDPC